MEQISRIPLKVEDLEEIMETYRRIQDAAEEEDLQSPFPVPYTSPEVIVKKKDAETHSTAKNPARVKQTYMGQAIGYSTTPLSSLSRISLQEMQVRQRHEGKYLLCKIITQPTHLGNVIFGVEDTNGWAQIVSLYNYPGTLYANEKELETLFPFGSVIAIREPSVKMSLTASHSHVPVESPSDILFIRPGDELLADIQWSSVLHSSPALYRSELEWKTTGDGHFRKEEYYAASVAYLRALEQQHSFTAARLNRSLALIKLQLYTAALEELRIALSTADLSISDQKKALYRSGQAHYGDGSYHDALKMYQECLALDQDLRETTGHFDWNTLYQEGLVPGSIPDVADFTGPIEIASVAHRGGGRGIISTRDVAAGELLLVSKPFAMSNQVRCQNNPIVVFSLHNSHVNGTRMLEILQQCVLKLSMCSKDTYKDFYSVYAGLQTTTQSKSDGPTPVTDHRSSFSRDVGLARLESVCSLNTFGLTSDYFDAKNPQEVLETGFDGAAALYILPSYFNHSCLPNATRIVLGSLLVVRACKDIPKAQKLPLPIAQTKETMKKGHISFTTSNVAVPYVLRTGLQEPK
ncbi:hypothetical protein FRC17_001092 [Serendipita sp. 399]|nr:hypothetical protein FRC17_001092 [Serendipita sp. 399]